MLSICGIVLDGVNLKVTMCVQCMLLQGNHNFGTTSHCRVPLRVRSNQQKVTPDVQTGCISCASGDGRFGGPLWWNTPLDEEGGGAFFFCVCKKLYVLCCVSLVWRSKAWVELNQEKDGKRVLTFVCARFAQAKVQGIEGIEVFSN